MEYLQALFTAVEFQNTVCFEVFIQALEKQKWNESYMYNLATKIGSRLALGPVSEKMASGENHIFEKNHYYTMKLNVDNNMNLCCWCGAVVVY